MEKSAKILICGENAEERRRLSDALVKILQKNNYAVDAVYDGEEAISFLDAVEYDAVLLDIMMPKKDGIAVLRYLREKGNSVPVIMLTAKSEVEDKVQGLDAGANDYISKPFDTRELLARIRVATRAQTGGDVVLRFGNVSLNCATFELAAPSGKFRLANKEFQMMELLMSNPGQIISTERFMEKIWGYDSETEINVVWVYISYLRKKLANLEASVEIKAIRNQGYSLEVHK